MQDDAIRLDVSTMPEDGDYAQFEAWRKGEKEEAAPAAEEAKTAPESDPDEDQETEEEKPKPEDRAVKGVQKRIDELTKARREAERRAEEAERKLAETQGSRPAKENAQPAAEKTAEDGKPKLEDFDSIEAYYEALTDWKIEQRDKARSEKAAADKAKADADTAQKAWQEKENAFKTDHADYDELIDSVEIPKGPGIQALQRAVMAAGPELLYELAKQPDVVKELVTLQPEDALVALGEFKAKLSKAPEKPQPKKETSAPPPPARVGSRPAAASKAVDDPDLDYAEFERLQNARERRNRR